jgi:hypothetical protein
VRYQFWNGQFKAHTDVREHLLEVHEIIDPDDSKWKSNIILWEHGKVHRSDGKEHWVCLHCDKKFLSIQGLVCKARVVRRHLNLKHGIRLGEMPDAPPVLNGELGEGCE